jgi:hypothetical protein
MHPPGDAACWAAGRQLASCPHLFGLQLDRQHEPGRRLLGSCRLSLLGQAGAAHGLVLALDAARLLLRGAGWGKAGQGSINSCVLALDAARLLTAWGGAVAGQTVACTSK